MLFGKSLVLCEILGIICSEDAAANKVQSNLFHGWNKVLLLPRGEIDVGNSSSWNISQRFKEESFAVSCMILSTFDCRDNVFTFISVIFLVYFLVLVIKIQRVVLKHQLQREFQGSFLLKESLR